MEKYVIVPTQKVVILFLLLLAHFSLFGCAGMERLVSADNRILFTEKTTNSGIFNDDGLTVEYNYRVDGKNLTLEGNVNYFGGVDSLNAYLLFIDATGNVLQRKIVYYSGYRVSRNWIADSSFRETLVVPPDAAGISFDYSAQPRSSQR